MRSSNKVAPKGPLGGHISDKKYDNEAILATAFEMYASTNNSNNNKYECHNKNIGSPQKLSKLEFFDIKQTHDDVRILYV